MNLKSFWTLASRSMSLFLIRFVSLHWFSVVSWMHLEVLWLVVQVVMAMYTCKDDNQRKQINAFMTAFQEHPQAWSRVDTILEQTGCDQSKFFVSTSACNLLQPVGHGGILCLCFFGRP